MSSIVPLLSFLFLLLMLLLVGTLPTATPTITFAANETDRHALLAIKSNIKHDPQGVVRSWNDSFHFCEWEGVTCGKRHRRVIIIDLSSRGLMGSLSPYVGNLSFLREIRLHNNTIEGDIPPQVGRLIRLQRLGLSNNSLEGEIPKNISHCSHLISLNLGFNKLVGKIPRELSSLLNLKILSIHYNNFSQRGIPPFLGNLTYLEIISATGNLFGGSIPHSLGQLENLYYLAVGKNNLVGIIPPSIYNLSFLTSLGFADNQLGGSLPLGLCLMLPHLRELELWGNQFIGPLPLSISNCSELQNLQMQSNNFTGKIAINFGHLQNLRRVVLWDNNLGSGEPDEMNFITSLANCSNLQALAADNNRLSGVLPNFVGNLSTQLFILSFPGNLIYGSLPSTIGNLIGLTIFDLENNQFTGAIPTSIGNLQKLQLLSLADNNFSGEIPDTMGNFSWLSLLNFSNNRLDGTIPSSLGKCQNLLTLIFFRNNLTGSIPKQLFEIFALSISLNLAQNRLSGPLPLEVGNLTKLTQLDVSENELSGEIPSSIGTCGSLENLNLEGNFFHGSIPQTLSYLRGIQNLDLSHNNFSGKIPRFLEEFALKNLNLSFNDFEGEVPMKGVFINESAISVVGNNRLCGGFPALQLPKCTTEVSKKRHKRSLTLIIVISMVCTLLGVTMMSSFFCFWHKKRRSEQPFGSLLKESFLKLSYDRLLKATDGFSSANVIGVGSFSSVYKGILNEDGVIVAVKVLNLKHRGSSKSFMAECEALRNVRHRNLVKVITACSSVDFKGNEFKALVYEFMPNGSLERWLHSSPETVQDDLHMLSLLERVNIAIDVACALDYLHHQCKNPIIHCDLKPSNVLFDRDMVAHVGDFGLARFLFPELLNENKSSSTGIRGTIGYVAPEYGLGSEVSTNGDVYSYGILLLEMMTGKRPTDPMFQEGLNLHNFARMALPDHVMDIAEPIFLTTDDDEVAPAAQIKYNTESLVSMIKIGVACSMESPHDRMDISDVIHGLHSVRDILRGTRTVS